MVLFYTMGVQLVSFNTQLIRSQIATAKFYFPLGGRTHFVFHQGVNLVLFSTRPIFPPCFTLGVNPPCFTLGGYGSAVPVRVPFGAVHGIATLKPRKAKEGIFSPVAKRYFYFGILT